MRRLSVVLLIVVAIVGLGFYRGWFTVNEEKIQQDEERAKEEVRELVNEVKAKASNRAEKVEEKP